MRYECISVNYVPLQKKTLDVFRFSAFSVYKKNRTLKLGYLGSIVRSYEQCYNSDDFTMSTCSGGI